MKKLKLFLLLIIFVNAFAIHAQNQNSKNTTENLNTDTPKGLYKTINRKSENPLLIINDFIWGNDTTILSIIKPNDIDKIKVLKDGAATQLYGEHGKHGVLIINLKDKNINTLEKFKTAYALHDGNSKVQKISGIIYDINKKPIPNVSITNMNRKESFKSDSEGNYSIIARENDLVTFYVNSYKISMLKVKGTKINVVLSSNSKSEISIK